MSGGAKPMMRLLKILEQARDLEWMDWASCLDTDPEAFFPEKGQPSGPAKRICEGCAVQQECLEYALRTSRADDWGVWGATSEQERRVIRTERQMEAAA